MVSCENTHDFFEQSYPHANLHSLTTIQRSLVAEDWRLGHLNQNKPSSRTPNDIACLESEIPIACKNVCRIAFWETVSAYIDEMSCAHIKHIVTHHFGCFVDRF
jgi:hypothetical protein